VIVRRLARWLAVPALLAMAPAMAGSFSVAPTRVELSGGARTAVVTLRNVAPEPLTVQVSVVGWSQQGGEDTYPATRDLLATPPVLTLEPDEERVVRIALRREPDPNQDLPFRVFFEEVPPAPRAGFNGVNVALRVGVPIFVRSASRTRADLRWELHSEAGGKLRIEAINQGTAHIQITGFELSAEGASAAPARVNVMKYVLPRSRMSWTVDAPAGTATNWKIHGFSDQGEFRSDAKLQAP
jgi:fimbrial chaperone protein